MANNPIRILTLLGALAASGCGASSPDRHERHQDEPQSDARATPARGGRVQFAMKQVRR